MAPRQGLVLGYAAVDEALTRCCMRLLQDAFREAAGG